MMPRKLLAALLLSGAVIGAGCSSSSPKTAATGTTTTGASATTTTAAAGATTTASSASGSTLSVSSTTAVGKPVLVDADGKTLYEFEPNGSSTTSQVPANIAPNWPPAAASGTPTAGDGVDVSKIAVNPQADGTQQLSYNGHLLYTFVGDAAAGDATGQGLGGIWFTVNPSGDKNP
jgi:predicted lipoprotein with Yx(FWY)xxD motif